MRAIGFLILLVQGGISCCKKGINNDPLAVSMAQRVALSQETWHYIDADNMLLEATATSCD